MIKDSTDKRPEIGQIIEQRKEQPPKVEVLNRPEGNNVKQYQGADGIWNVRPS